MDNPKGTFPNRHFPALYFTIYPMLAEAARKLGYALAVHGSLGRDFDLIAVPWTDEAAEPSELIEAMRKATAGMIQGTGNPTAKPHGRMSWNVELSAGAYLDVSVMLKASPPAPGVGEALP